MGGADRSFTFILGKKLGGESVFFSRDDLPSFGFRLLSLLGSKKQKEEEIKEIDDSPGCYTYSVTNISYVKLVKGYVAVILKSFFV